MNLEQLLNVTNIVFCIIIAIAVEIQRRGVEHFVPQLGLLFNKTWSPKSSKLWNELLLPLAPLGTGAILAGFITSYPYPEMFANAFWPRVFFGIVCGLASAHVYKIAKKWIAKKSE